MKLGNKPHWDLFTNKEGNKLFVFEHSQHHVAKSAAGASKATDLYERWSQFEPDKEYTIRPRTLKDWRSSGITVLSIVYSSDKWTGKATAYVHQFERPPKITTGLDSKKIVRAAIISGPHIRVTARGIEG